MTTQEMIFDYLKVQGLVPEYDEDKDIRFKYQMRNFVVSNYPDDAVPANHDAVHPST